MIIAPLPRASPSGSGRLSMIIPQNRGLTITYTPFHLALNAGFIALTWACAHASLLSSPDILDLRLQDRESKLANKNPENYKRYPEKLEVHISRALLFAIPSYAIRCSGSVQSPAVTFLLKTGSYGNRAVRLAVFSSFSPTFFGLYNSFTHCQQRSQLAVE